LIISV